MNKNEVRTMRPPNALMNLMRIDLVGLFVLLFLIITLTEVNFFNTSYLQGLKTCYRKGQLELPLCKITTQDKEQWKNKDTAEGDIT